MNMKIPKNIRQIGECNSSRKIYIEDYVVTFLNQLAMKKEGASSVAVLYGQTEHKEEGVYYFVMGAAECVSGQAVDGEALISEEERIKALRNQEEYFSGYDIIGWALLQNENDVIAKEAVMKTNLKWCGQGNRLYYELHAEDGTEQFVLFESGILRVADGYHIFYDRNEGMQNYLVKWNEMHTTASEERINDRVARQFRTIYYNRKEEKGQRQIIGLLYTTTLMLLTFCCVMGISMMNNYEKMKSMETALHHLVLAMEEQRLPDVTKEVMAEAVESKPLSGEMPTEEIPAEGAGSAVQTGADSDKAESADSQTSEPAETADSSRESSPLVAGSAEESTHAVYIVQKGDTLLKISRRFYNSADMIDEICALNQIENPNDIMQQQKILLP